MKNFDRFVSEIYTIMETYGFKQAIYGVLNCDCVKEFVEHATDAFFYKDDVQYRKDVDSYIQDGAMSVYALHLK